MASWFAPNNSHCDLFRTKTVPAGNHYGMIFPYRFAHRKSRDSLLLSLAETWVPYISAPISLLMRCSPGGEATVMLRSRTAKVPHATGDTEPSGLWSQSRNSRWVRTLSRRVV